MILKNSNDWQSLDDNQKEKTIYKAEIFAQRQCGRMELTYERLKIRSKFVEKMTSFKKLMESIMNVLLNTQRVFRSKIGSNGKMNFCTYSLI